jgi:hypothetical protein
MKLSLSRARESCLVWMFWFLGAWLALETGPLFAGVWIFNIPLRRLVGPYIALAIAPAVVGPFIYGINRRRADPPKRRARHRHCVHSVDRVGPYGAGVLRCKAWYLLAEPRYHLHHSHVVVQRPYHLLRGLSNRFGEASRS